MRLAIPHFNIFQHSSTMLNGVEQNVEIVWPGLYANAVRYSTEVNFAFVLSRYKLRTVQLLVPIVLPLSFIENLPLRK